MAGQQGGHGHGPVSGAVEDVAYHCELDPTRRGSSTDAAGSCDDADCPLTIAVRSDPAIERWSEMHSTMYERFRFTPKRTRQFALWGVGVPVLTYYLASYANNRWDLRAATREDTLTRGAAPATKEANDKDE